MKNFIELKEGLLRPALEMRMQGFSFRSISKIILVPETTIRQWISKFALDTSNRIYRIEMKKSPVASEPMPKNETNTDYEALQQRISELEAQLKQETIRADFYDEMINVAEAKFKISIRKKAGTNQ